MSFASQEWQYRQPDRHEFLQILHFFVHVSRGNANVEEIDELAKHIHDLAHKGKSIKHLREDVIELDEQVHRADEVITKIARHGVRAEHFNGVVRQNRRIVKAMNAILHHLEDDLAELDPDYLRGHRHETLRPGLDHLRIITTAILDADTITPIPINPLDMSFSPNSPRQRLSSNHQTH